MNQELNWNFVSTGGGDEDGLNNSTIEHFTGNYNYFLAREIIQNSLDAKDKKSPHPVKVAFKLERFTKDDFPGYYDLLGIYKAAKNHWRHSNETTTFLEKAISCLKEDEIPFLRISDYNTVGLNGSDKDMSGGWFNLVRSSGASPKSAGEGGSFGIGKGAPFAASELRVVFYATKNQQAQSVFQGKAELVSFLGSDNDIKRGVGSYGIGQSSVRNHKDIPELFWRKTQGTDILIAGYRETKNWIEDLTKSVLRNFWYAIYCKDLVVEVGDNQINYENLSQRMVEYFANEPFKDTDEPIGNPLQYYLSVVQGEELGEGHKLKHLGICKFHFLQTEEHLNYVAMIRKSRMIIYSRAFRFPGNFAGVFICENDTGNTELRKMEPPAHDKWDPKRHKEKGEAIIEEITLFIRKCLEKVKQKQSFGILEIPELYRHLPLDDGEESGGHDGEQNTVENEGNIETAKLIQKRETFNATVEISPYKVTVINERDYLGGEEPGQGFGESDGEGGDKPGRRGGGSGTNRRINIKTLKTRSYLISKEGDKLTYKVIVRSQEDKKCTLKFSAVGEEGADSLQLLGVTDANNNKYLFSGNKIQHFSLGKDVTKEFEITIRTPYKVSLKIVANEVQ